ncbi:MAG: glutamate-1-semialdehyde 2,1-aminomutase [Bacteroidales bacterium]|nr:glutamate-1-semialdehyde 2,1-aminomutase [Bacteroidales bacterium]
MNINTSISEFSRAKQHIASGVNSPVRAFKNVNSSPIFVKSAKGAYITDVDDSKYIDFVCSWGPMILGHAHERVTEAVKKAAERGTSYGAPTIQESEMAEQINKMMPNIELVRMVNSGTEATMSAIRLARAYTKRDMFIKFEGCYHGHGDSFLIKAGSGAITLGLPDSPGVTKGTAKDTLIATYNDAQSVKKLFEQYPNQIAAVIVEPVGGNMGVVTPKNDFLKQLREITNQNNALLIFDEVITGFRIAKGGAAEYFGVKPDLVTLGKIIGGGLPVGAYGGKREIMNMIAPDGPVYQAGTLSGNPLAMAAGLETLKIIDEDPDFYNKLNKKADFLVEGFSNNAKQAGIDVAVNRCGSMMTFFFNSLKEINNYNDAIKSDTKLYAKYFLNMINQGIWIAPSQFECTFVSAAQTFDDLQKAVDANAKALKLIK